MTAAEGIVRLTAAQAAIRYLAAQWIATRDGGAQPYFAGCWAIFGHGNALGLGEALYAERDTLPTYRAHNEQAMAHAAIAYGKQKRRRRAMICTSSIGPGATNMVTAAASAHVNRLPVLFLPGDVFAGRGPDPVLQQVEAAADATISANDCFRPVSRLFDRIMRPEQLLDALPRAMAILLDPASCGPVTLAFPQDVQTEAFDWPAAFFERRVRRVRAPRPDAAELARLADCFRTATAPLIVAGGGVLYAEAEVALADFAVRRNLPVAETQAGKGALAWDHASNVGAIGVTGAPSANAAARGDLIVGIGTRLTDFTTGSRALIGRRQRLAQINVTPSDADKHDAIAVMADARETLALLDQALGEWRAPPAWIASLRRISDPLPIALGGHAPSDADVVEAVCQAVAADTIVVGAAGGLPGALHRRWRVRVPGSYHVEYGFSCMGYEIAGGLGVALAEPDRAVMVMVGDGSYLMMNSDLATAVAMRARLIVTLLDNRGHGCIDRLQRAHGCASSGALLGDADPAVDFVAHARSLGALAEHAADLPTLRAAITRAETADRPVVIVIETGPDADGGSVWWDVAVPAVSARSQVGEARADYEARLRERFEGGSLSASG